MVISLTCKIILKQNESSSRTVEKKTQQKTIAAIPTPMSMSIQNQNQKKRKVRDTTTTSI